MAALFSLSPSPLPLRTSIFFPTKSRNSLNPCVFSLGRTSSPSPNVKGRTSVLPYPSRGILQKSNKIWRASATSGDGLPSETPVETAQQIIQSDDGSGGASTIISVLLFVAFVGLLILSIGVIYIAVKDFLEKREREAFEKEEAAKATKKKGKKGPVRDRAGPRGFGQKIDEDDEY